MDLVDLQGQQLGNYHIIRLLGTGSMADVYLAKHTHLPKLPSRYYVSNYRTTT